MSRASLVSTAALKNRIGRAKGYGACWRCGDTWNWKKPHPTTYETGSSCFPLCDECWPFLTPEERLPYYRSLWQAWMTEYLGAPWDDGDYMDRLIEKWPKIREAVLAGG